MENQYLCDLFRIDYEQYLKQAILFSKKVNVMYTEIDYPRENDKRYMEMKTSSLKKYLGFENVNLVPMKGKSDRFFDFEKNPIALDTICRELHLTEVEKNVSLNIVIKNLIILHTMIGHHGRNSALICIIYLILQLHIQIWQDYFAKLIQIIKEMSYQTQVSYTTY